MTACLGARYSRVAMRRVAVGVGLVLTAVAVALFVLLSQTEVVRLLRQGASVAILVVGVEDATRGSSPAETIGVALVHPGGRGTWLSVPRNLVWPTAGGWNSLHGLFASEGTPGIARRLASALEIAIPYWVVVDYPGLQTVVDALGGVELTVATRLVYQDRARNLFIDIPPGRQTFNGAKVVDFVRFPDDEEPARLERLHGLLQALLDKARGLSPVRWRSAVAAFQAAVSTNLSVWETWDMARAVGGVSPERTALFALPGVPRAVGSPDLVPDLVRLRKLVQGVVRGQAFLTRDGVRVLVLNGTGTKLLAASTAAWLADLGFTVVGKADADRSNYPHTYVVVREETRAKGRAVLEVLPPTVQPRVQLQTDREFDLARVGGWPQDTDVILILGAGFDVRP